MSGNDPETDFLRNCLRYENSAEHDRVDEAITRVQRDERCVWRAVGLMGLLAALSLAGVCYTTVFLADSPENMTQLITPLIVKVFCALGVGSLICMLAFAGLGLVYRKDLDRRRNECRRLAARLLESRLGKPEKTTVPGSP